MTCFEESAVLFIVSHFATPRINRM